MFDIGFSELIVIALVALIVIGPERLPRVARTVGALLGRAQRYVNDVKSDIQREVDLGELKNISSTFQDAARSVEQSVSQFGKEMQDVGDSLNQSVTEPAQATVHATEETQVQVAAHTSEGAPAHEETAEHSASAQMDLGLEAKPGADSAPVHKA